MSIFLKKKDNLCCRYCDCQLVYSRHRSSDDDFTVIDDLSQLISDSQGNKRAFTCSDDDNDRTCEIACRDQISKLTKYTPITNLEQNEYRPLLDREDSDELCKLIKNKENAPGVDLSVRISTGPRDLGYFFKEITLGNICCQRTCKCDLMYICFYSILNIKLFWKFN